VSSDGQHAAAALKHEAATRGPGTASAGPAGPVRGWLSLAQRGQSGSKLLSVQYLRGVAAIAVLVYHSGTDARWANVWPLKGFGAGVDVFFVISGFIMWVTTAGRGMGPREFWRRRAERIVPLYWMVTTLAVLVAVVSTHYGGKTNPWHVISSFLFLPANNPQTHNLEPLVSPGWTLNYEMFFYAIFGSFLVVSARRRFVGIAVVLGGLVIAGRVITAHFVPLEFYGNSLVLEFVFGMALGALFKARRLSLPRGVAWAGLALGFILLGAIDSVHTVTPVIAIGIPATIIVGSALCLEHTGIREWRIPKLLGDASYSIYLAHGIFLDALKAVYFKTSLPSVGFFVLGIAGSICFGIAVYLFIEAPLTARIQAARRSSHRPAASDFVVAEAVAPQP
jgi:exopolysaccharide production protein ExoZ